MPDVSITPGVTTIGLDAGECVEVYGPGPKLLGYAINLGGRWNGHVSRCKLHALLLVKFQGTKQEAIDAVVKEAEDA